MKKGFIVLLIAVLVAGFAFASFSGSADVRFIADFDEKDYGFANATSFSFNFNLVTEEVKIAEGEGIHAEVEANASLIAATTHKTGEDTALIVNKLSDKAGFGAVVNIKTVKIVGDKWYVDILGVKGVYDYAKAGILRNYKDVKDAWGFVRTKTYTDASYAIAYSKAPGVTVGYDGYTASFGFYHDGDDGTKASATIESKKFKFADDAVTVQAAAEASKKQGTKALNVGASVKGSAKIQEIEVALAADFGLGNLRTDDGAYFAMDARADFSYDFISANVYAFLGDDDGNAKLTHIAGDYYKFYLEAGVDADLNSFDVPVTVGVTAKNIVDVQEKAVGAAAGIDLGISAEYAKDAITAGAWADFNTETKAWDANVYGSYAAEKFTAGANVYIDGTDELSTLSFGLFAESDALVNGATLGVNYGLNNGYVIDRGYGGAATSSNALNTNNFIGDEPTIGTLGCYCKVAF